MFSHLKKVVVMNLLFGLMSPRIDNWGHVGGLLGGSYVSFFFGPEKVYATRPRVRAAPGSPVRNRLISRLNEKMRGGGQQ